MQAINGIANISMKTSDAILRRLHKINKKNGEINGLLDQYIRKQMKAIKKMDAIIGSTKPNKDG